MGGGLGRLEEEKTAHSGELTLPIIKGAWKKRKNDSAVSGARSVWREERRASWLGAAVVPRLIAQIDKRDKHIYTKHTDQTKANKSLHAEVHKEAHWGLTAFFVECACARADMRRTSNFSSNFLDVSGKSNTGRVDSYERILCCCRPATAWQPFVKMRNGGCCETLVFIAGLLFWNMAFSIIWRHVVVTHKYDNDSTH